MGLYSNFKAILSARAKQLQNSAKPSTKVDSGGTQSSYSFKGQEITPDELRQIKEIRESGGVISQLMRYKALIIFGTGAEFEADNDAVAEYLHSVFNDLDNLLIDLGEDALWYPYSMGELVETRGGDFSHVEGIEPWTMLPQTDEYGDVIAWEQQIQGSRETDIYQPEEIASFVLNKSSSRDKTGISALKRAEDEIQAYKENQEAIQQAVEMAAFRRHWWKIGREGAGVIDDNELRRVRNRLSNLEGDTQIFTGQDVDHELMDAMNPDSFKSISEMDMRNLCLALGVPIELGSVISEGLGSGEQSGVRMQAFLLEAKALQRALADEFIQEVVRPVLQEYSPFDSDENIELVFGEPLEDEISEAEYMQNNDSYFTANEIRQAVNKAPADDDEIGESYRKPANIQAPEDEEPEGDMGIFGKEMQDVEDIDMSDYPEAAQENARMALEAREETGNPNDCGTRVGWERANQLDNGEDLTEDTISRMAQFERHEDNKEQGEEGRADCGWMMWKAWGGDEGIEWAQDKMDEIEQAKEAARGETGNPYSRDVEAWEDMYLSLYDRIWTADESKNLLEFSPSQVPEMVKNNLREAIMSGSVFSDIDGLGGDDIMQVRQFLTEQLEDDRWNIDGIADRLMDVPGIDSRDRAETIARTELASTVNTARQDAYEERVGPQEELRYRWTGVSDARTTEACTWLKEQTHPEFGGEPVSMDELQDLIAEAPEHDPEMQDNLSRPENFLPHINCRHTWVRHVSG